MYDGMRPFLKYKGDTESKFFLTMGDDMYHPMRKWFYERNGDEELVKSTHDDGKPISSHKLKTQNKMLSIITQSLKQYNIDAHKKFVEFKKSTEGITTQKRFYTSTYGFENSREYLLGETDKLKKGQTWDRHSQENVIQWWKNKASKRYETLKSDGRLRTEIEVWRKDNMEKIDIIR